jgi:Flp pilus assembly pilin Flp
MTNTLQSLHQTVRDLRRREEGQGFTEYVVLIALIALALFLAITFFSDQLGAVFSAIASIVQNELPT